MSAEELSVAKDSFARSLAGDFEESPQTASNIGNLFVYNLPNDYYRVLPGQIDAVTGADVSRVAKDRLTPEQMVVVGVGDNVKISPEIAKLNLGTVVAVDANGTQLKPEQKAATTASNK